MTTCKTLQFLKTFAGRCQVLQGEVMNDFIKKTGLKEEFTDCGELLQNKGFSVAPLKISEQKICVHKNILAMKSQSFEHLDVDFLSVCVHKNILAMKIQSFKHLDIDFLSGVAGVSECCGMFQSLLEHFRPLKDVSRVSSICR